MNDQAHLLRNLMERRTRQETSAPLPGARAQTIAVTSGKGGVGKSNIALNLAIALSNAGKRVCLLDANLGLGNIDLLCGLNGYWNLSHVISGARNIQEIMLDGPAGVHLIPGASGLEIVVDANVRIQHDILSQLEELEQTHDYLVIDTGTGIHRSVRQFVTAADMVLVLTTPEPTSIADAYAAIKVLNLGNGLPVPQVLVNQANSGDQAREIATRLQQTAQTFLHISVEAAGFVPFDPGVPLAVTRRTPFLLDAPKSAAARAVEQLAQRMVGLQRSTTRPSFFSELQRFASKHAA